MKRPTKNELRELKIFNPHGLCQKGGGGVYVCYIPEQRGRAASYARWQVIRPGYRTDPKGHWTDGYNKTFDVSKREEKEPQRLAAIAWASGRYGVTEWERDPWGDWHPAGTMERAVRAAAEAA